MRDRTVHAVVLVASIIVGAVFAVVVPSAPAHAQYPGGGAIGGGGGSVFNGGTITNGITFSGVTTDIATPGSEDLTVAPGGDFIITPNGVGAGRGLTVDGTSTGVRMLNRASVNVGAVTLPNVGGARLGSQSDKGIGTHIGCFADALTSANAGTDLFCVDGVGVEIGSVGVTASNNLAGTLACDASHVTDKVWYSDTSTSKISICVCEQTGAATFAWGAVTSTGDCT